RTRDAALRDRSFVDVLRRLDHRLDRFPAPVGHSALEEATVATGVAGDAADLFDLEQHHVVVAVDAHVEHALRVAGLLALVPQLPARARPIHGLAQFGGARERLAIHPREHQHVARGRLLRDHRNEPVFVPAHLVEPGLAHSRTSMPRARMTSLASRTVCWPKWKMLAASTASAWPMDTPSAR